MALRPGLSTLFMSGYPADLAPHEVTGFLHKPFSPQELAARVQEALAQE